MTPSEALSLVRGLMACYPQATMGPENIQAYARNLADLERDVASVAMKRCVAACKFFPSVAEIREQAASCLDNAPDAEEAWGIVMAEVRRKGYNGKPEFPHSRIADAVQAIGGWYEICTSENATADRSHFVKAYQAATKRSRDAVVMASVPALSEARANLLGAGEGV